MKLKYMLRGLGLGIIITAAVMGACSRNAVADARVQVLKEYGLGEEPVVTGETENSEEDTESSTISETTEPVILRDEDVESEISSVLDAAIDAEHASTEQQESPVEETLEDATTQTAETVEQATSAEQQEPSTEAVVIVTPSDEPSNTGDGIQIVISKGDDSGTVSRKLYNAGLIENAAEYDAFLMQHGYDKKISTGTKIIYATDSWQEIAEKLTSK